MLKACLKLFTSGIIMIFVGVIGIGVLIGTNMIDEDDLTISFGSSSSSAYESAVDSGYDGYNYTTIGSKESNITSLDIDIGMGSFILVKGDEFALSTDGIVNDKFSYEVKDGCLYVGYSPEFNLLSLDFNFTASDKDSSIILTVPKDDFDSVTLNMTAGDVFVQEINAKNLNTKVSAGSMYLESVYADSASFKMTAGDFTVSNSTVKNAAISMTAGDMLFSDCKLYGDNNIKMTAGELNMCLIGDRQDYKINIDRALGDVYINGMNMNDKYEETTFATTTVVLTETTVTRTASDDRAELVEQEDRDRVPDNEKPNGSIDINMTAGNCYIEFLGGE